MFTKKTKPLLIYTDGSCINYKDPEKRALKGSGGWAFIVLTNPRVYASGFSPAPQTNNTMEMRAVFEAMKWAYDNAKDEWVLIKSDSTYVINGMLSGLSDFFDDIPNADIWEELYDLKIKMPRLRYSHVKGHAGDKFNEMCDRIASRARKQGLITPNNRILKTWQ